MDSSIEKRLIGERRLRDMRLVLDATAIRSGMTISGQHEWFITPSVVDELKKGKTARDLELLQDITMRVTQPSGESVEKVREAAEVTGDISRLSDTDMEVLALGLELEAIILTDDYSIQNLAKVLKIDYQPGITPGIKEVFHWTYRCRGCGRIFNSEPENCPICGSDIKTVRKKGS